MHEYLSIAFGGIEQTLWDMKVAMLNALGCYINQSLNIIVTAEVS